MRKTAMCVGVMLAANVFADVLSFDLKGDAAVYGLLDDKMSGSVTNSGLVVTVTASDGVLNRTSSGFGVNGAGTDDTDALNIGQYIDLVFNRNVSFSNLVVSSWGASDAGEVRLGPAFVSQGSISGSGDTPFDFMVDAGETVRIFATADSGASNGFSIDGFSAVVPEPAVLCLVAAGSGTLMLCRRRKR